MNERNREIKMSEELGESNPAPEVESSDEESAESQEFAWYGGKVDESIVREIVRLKRVHKE